MGDTDDVDRARVERWPALRALYLVLGLLCLGLAYLSWLPGIPTVGVVASLALSGTLLTDSGPLRIVLVLVGAYAVWFVWSRPRDGEPMSPSSEPAKTSKT